MQKIAQKQLVYLAHFIRKKACILNKCDYNIENCGKNNNSIIMEGEDNG